ncbi:hypothetical protein N0V93_003609 [Gnomoniopsis smithogilvyi]|uniref:Peptidase S66 n=1 Tax=Gnomoniopsis smithogilvyi TaxID=1191159 RepID=A0A9W9D004_9PEZI|nr:hypothetical protein N0V93_003609 [Gnomoniopsis smithogilvyi]
MAPGPNLPKALPPGGTIALISPSERMHETFSTATQRGIKVLESLGYTVKPIWTHEDPATKTIASHIAVRKAELLKAFADPAVDAIICMVGGSTFTELTPSLLHDPEALQVLKDNPKVVVGYSDISHLHWLLYSQTGLRTFYGPMLVSELAELPQPAEYSMRHMLAAITKPQPVGRIQASGEWRSTLAPYFRDEDSIEASSYKPTPAWRWLRKGQAEGRAFGGCLSVVVRLQAIPALVPDWSGRIVFLETSMAEGDVWHRAPPTKVRQQLADLVSQGLFDRVSGVVLGRFYGWEEHADELDRIVREVIIENPWVKNAKYPEIPVLYGVDLGHTSPMITIPYDALCRLDSEKDEFSILEAGVV